MGCWGRYYSRHITEATQITIFFVWVAMMSSAACNHWSFQKLHQLLGRFSRNFRRSLEQGQINKLRRGVLSLHKICLAMFSFKIYFVISYFAHAIFTVIAREPGLIFNAISSRQKMNWKFVGSVEPLPTQSSIRWWHANIFDTITWT